MNNIMGSEILRTVIHRPVTLRGVQYNLSTYPYLDIVLTDRCNSRCRFCVADLIHDKLDCNLKIFEKQIDYAVKELGVKEVLILGGEPTVSKDLFNIILHCCGHRDQLAKICMTTNGKLFADRVFRTMVLQSGVSHINISVMSFKEDAQAFVHRSRHNIGRETLKQVYREAEDNGVHIRINNNVYRGNNDTLGDLVRFYDEVKDVCHSVKFSPLLRTDSFSVIPEINEFNRDYILSPEEYEELFESVVGLYPDLPRIINPMTFGFVEYKAILLPVPILLNYNHRGMMLKRAVEFGEINNIKLLPNGNLSRSWNREVDEHVIRFAEEA